MNDTYKFVIADKDTEINRLNQKILSLEVEKTKAGSTESEALQSFTLKIR